MVGSTTGTATIASSYAGNTTPVSSLPNLGFGPGTTRVPDVLYTVTSGTTTGTRSYFYGPGSIGTGNADDVATNSRPLADLQTPTDPGATTYTDWSTTNWDFGISNQLPALKRAKDATTYPYENADERGTALPDLLPVQGR